MINVLYFLMIIFFEYHFSLFHYFYKFVSIILLFFNNIIFNQHIQFISTIGIFLELINWMIYLYMYTKIINPTALYLNKNDINKVVSKIDKFNKFELEHIIKGSIVYDKSNHKNIDYQTFDIKEMTKKEIIMLLGHTLFGIEPDKIFQSIEIQSAVW